MLYFGSRSGFISTVAVIAAVTVGAAHAQSRHSAQGPAEFPPASYASNQYVDSRGCAFVRPANGGVADWAPHLAQSGEHLCGFAPSQAANATSAITTPATTGGTSGDTVTRARAVRSSIATIVGISPVPASNPTSNTNGFATPHIPNGYERVFTDGRLNTQRGLPTR